MNRGPLPEQARTDDAVCDDFVAHVAALDRALRRGDLSRATLAELRALGALLGEVEHALDHLVVAVDSATDAS